MCKAHLAFIVAFTWRSGGMPPGKTKCNEIESRGDFKIIPVYELCTLLAKEMK